MRFGQNNTGIGINLLHSFSFFFFYKCLCLKVEFMLTHFGWPFASLHPFGGVFLFIS